ncbi:MAG: gliding motility-associated C-terminal domain-containing protein [Bacteroidetes bacterium]|nr:gliding motility-associated C-terminal domain-containing protein [Bacteroidota bacterium]MBL7103545.1 gliding motility-associated C-terminal domain-containing protein [Bacteroidales bacterium]
MKIKFFITFFLSLQFYLSFAQVDAGEDVTISAGLPIMLSGEYLGYTGTPVTAQDDYFVGPFEIGFDFTYFGEIYTQFAIGPNGLVSFDVPDILGFSYWDPVSIPNNTFPITIMGPYQDLFRRPITPHNEFIYYKTVGEEPGRKLIVGWCEAPMFNCESQKATYQIVLNENDNSIVNNIIAKPACEANLGNKATQGVNFNDDLGIVVPGRNNTSWTAFNESWRFDPQGPDNYTITSVNFEPEIIVPVGKLSWAWYKDNYPDGEVISNNQSVVVHPTESTTYFAEITLCGGMKYWDNILVQVIPIPNAFNPNSPVEQNRVFKVFANPENRINNFKMYIYNSWGQQIFETNDINEGWDGTLNGNPCNSGVYVWVVYYEDENGTVTNKGTVTLVK